MSELKWRNRYEKQVRSNNLLSDRLRKTRELAMQKLNEYTDSGRKLLQHCTVLGAQLRMAQTEVGRLQAILEEHGIDYARAEELQEQEEVSDDEGGEVRAAEALEEEAGGEIVLPV